ncbi:MAG: Gfo/Idh/MocA family oxidoreductase [Flavisolibacter sp.]
MYKFAIIGCGRISRRHAEQIQKVGILQAVCDIIPQRSAHLAKDFGATAYGNIDELLLKEKDAAVICVCSPNGLHAEHSIKSLQAGKHVLCEKPLSISSVAGRQMVDTAFFFEKKLFVVKQNRFNPPVRAVKDLINDNKLGKILSFQVNCFWNRPQQYYVGDWKGSLLLDGGILYTQFSHFIDIIFWLLGDVAEVRGFKSNHLNRKFMEIEDNGVAILRMVNGALGTLNYTINSVNKNLEGSISIFGEKGSVKIGGQYLNTIEWLESVEPLIINVDKTSAPNLYGFYQGSMSNHDQVYEQLVASLNGNISHSVEADEAIKTIELIEKIYAATDAK